MKYCVFKFYQCGLINVQTPEANCVEFKDKELPNEAKASIYMSPEFRNPTPEN